MEPEPILPPPAGRAAGDRVYKIRTMEEDLAAQKRGAPPANIPLRPTPAQSETPSPSERLFAPPAPEKPAAPPPEIPEPIDLGSLGPVETQPAAFPPVLPPKKSAAEPEKAPAPKLEPAAQKQRRKLFLLIGAASLIVLALVFEVWWFFIRPGGEEPAATPEEFFPAPEATLPAQPATPEPTPAAPQEVAVEEFLNYGRVETIVAAAATPAAVGEVVKKGTGQNYPENTLVFLKILVDEQGRRRAISLDELAAGLKITINPQVRNGLGGDYNLFLTSRNPFDRSTCERAGVATTGCSGPRLGLAFAVKNASAAKAALAAWEPTMAQNLQALILASPSIGSGSFLDASYKNIALRYRNFPIDTISVDYALNGNTILIATSKSSMFAAVDAIK